jgi:hypothetical protein
MALLGSLGGVDLGSLDPGMSADDTSGLVYDSGSPGLLPSPYSQTTDIGGPNVAPVTQSLIYADSTGDPVLAALNPSVTPSTATGGGLLTSGNIVPFTQALLGSGGAAGVVQASKATPATSSGLNLTGTSGTINLAALLPWILIIGGIWLVVTLVSDAGRK